MNILSIDCGEHTGFATLINGEIRSGVEHWKHRTNESAGMKYLRFDAWLDEIDRIGRFDLFVYEKPHGLQGNAVESMNGYITGIHRHIAKAEGITSAPRSVNYQAVSPATIKKWAIGNGRASKEDMCKWFNGCTGRDPETDDESDALAILFFICSELSIETRLEEAREKLKEVK